MDIRQISRYGIRWRSRNNIWQIPQRQRLRKLEKDTALQVEKMILHSQPAKRRRNRVFKPSIKTWGQVSLQPMEVDTGVSNEVANLWPPWTYNAVSSITPKVCPSKRISDHGKEMHTRALREGCTSEDCAMAFGKGRYLSVYISELCKKLVVV